MIDFFRQALDRIAFIDLKKNPDRFDLDLKDVSLPVLRDAIMKMAQSDRQELKASDILDGIAFILAADPDFKNNHAYRLIAEALVSEPVESYFNKGLTLYQAGDKDALIYFKAAHELDPNHLMNAAQYAAALFSLSEDEEDEGDDLRRQSVTILERLSLENPTFEYGLYLLAECYRRMGHYQKSEIYYQKAMAHTDDPLAKQAVQERIHWVHPEALMERAKEMLERYDNANAIAVLNEVVKDTNRYDAWYALGRAYYGVDQFEASIEAFEQSLHYGGGQEASSDIYSDLAVAQHAAGKIKDAFQTLSEGISQSDDPLLRYNRLLIALALGDRSTAQEDLEDLMMYGDLSDEILNNILIIKESYDL